MIYYYRIGLLLNICTFAPSAVDRSSNASSILAALLRIRAACIATAGCCD